MKINKKLGIWMDHASAHLMEFTPDPITTKTITSKFTPAVRETIIRKGEDHLHRKEQQQQSDYYQQLREVIKEYSDVILFGPTDAKVELYNSLLADQQLKQVTIKMEQTDKLTENQQHAFVKNYFTKHCYRAENRSF
jgi:ABC-type branched-subunit amino acid transport system substrate-binding protein